MPIRKVARLGHPVLRQKTREVTREEISSPEMRRLVKDMIETMHEYGGVGLAAPQVHESVRLAIRDSFTGPSGLTPAQVAERVLDAIRANRFWIITHPGERPVFETRIAGILADFPREPSA